MKKVLILFFVFFALFSISAQEVKTFKINSWNRIIKQNIIKLYEGSKSFLLFYDIQGNLISQTEEVSSEIIHVFEQNQRVVLSDTYYPSDISYTYIYNQNGDLVKEFANPGITYNVGFIDKQNLFYLIVFNGAKDISNASNKLIIFNLSGEIIHEYIYSQKETYTFKDNDNKITFELIQPEVP